jgi:DNA mismatch endonuclease (patch repair protein)
MSPTKQGSVAAELKAPERKPPASTPGTQKSMRANRRTGTKPELALRKELHCRGLRFRKDFLIRLDGARARPDIVFTRAKVAVLLDGCFWHGCIEHGMRPKQNAALWNRKIDETIERDRRVSAALTNAGWTVIHVWEHEPIADAAGRIESVVCAALGDYKSAGPRW